MSARGSVEIHNPPSAQVVVPFVDLKAQYASLKKEVDVAIARVFENKGFTMGNEVRAFEEAFAGYQGAKFCVGVISGTAALHLGWMVWGIGPVSEVIPQTL